MSNNLIDIGLEFLEEDQHRWARYRIIDADKFNSFCIESNFMYGTFYNNMTLLADAVEKNLLKIRQYKINKLMGLI